MGPLATVRDAKDIVRMLLASYPNQAHDPETLQKQLIIALTGRPFALLQKLVNPIDGIVAKEKFTPSVAVVTEWLNKNTPPAPIVHPEHRLFLPEPAWTPPTEEAKRRSAEMWNKTKRQLEATAQAMRLSGRLRGGANG